MADPPRHTHWLIARVLLTILAGVIATFALATISALWIPIRNAPGVVALDGDHLDPWIIRLSCDNAERIIFFEKGRIWNRPGVGPPNGSSSAVACSSFATSTRSTRNFSRGEVAVPPDLVAEMKRSPQTCWGVAEDRRGWPFLAFRCELIAPTSPIAPTVYLVRGGLSQPPKKTNTIESLADVRAIPLIPIWPGLLADVAVFAAAAWVILFFISMFRGYFRRCRGHCPRCDYDLTDLLQKGCLECGWRRIDAPTRQPHPPARIARSDSRRANGSFSTGLRFVELVPERQGVGEDHQDDERGPQ